MTKFLVGNFPVSAPHMYQHTKHVPAHQTCTYTCTHLHVPILVPSATIRAVLTLKSGHPECGSGRADVIWSFSPDPDHQQWFVDRTSTSELGRGVQDVCGCNMGNRMLTIQFTPSLVHQNTFCNLSSRPYTHNIGIERMWWQHFVALVIERRKLTTNYSLTRNIDEF